MNIRDVCMLSAMPDEAARAMQCVPPPPPPPSPPPPPPSGAATTAPAKFILLVIACVIFLNILMAKFLTGRVNATPAGYVCGPI